MLVGLGPPIAFAIVVWWLGTGVILYLDGLARSTFRRSLIWTTAIACISVVGIIITKEMHSVFAAYVSFTCGLVIWGWLEMAFLMGFLTGPRRVACTAERFGWERTVQAIQTILYYEVAIIFTGAILLATSWNAPNQIGAWTFFLLFAMRLSAKLNVFLGVRNLSEEFLPKHLRYLATYFTRKNMNPFFPFSMGASIIVFGLLIEAMTDPSRQPFETTAHAFVATLMCLAILEHVFMVMPLSLSGLWRWSLRS